MKSYETKSTALLESLNIIKKFMPLAILVLVLSVSFQTEINTAETRIFRVSDRKFISYRQLVEDIQKVNLIMVGETHDKESHHRIQLYIIKALQTSNTPLAVGFEMFTYESQRDLDQWVEGIISLEEFIKIYYKNWNFPWPLYSDIFKYVKEKKIPAIGLNVPADISRKVANSGFASLTKRELERLPPEVGCAVDQQYMRFIRRAYAMHKHSGKNFLFFCEAQLLWDQIMAKNIIEYLKKNPYKTIIALTGNGHAWKRGVPEQVQLVSKKIRYKVILPEVTGYIDRNTITIQEADYILSQ